MNEGSPLKCFGVVEAITAHRSWSENSISSLLFSNFLKEKLLASKTKAFRFELLMSLLLGAKSAVRVIRMGDYPTLWLLPMEAVHGVHRTREQDPRPGSI